MGRSHVVLSNRSYKKSLKLIQYQQFFFDKGTIRRCVPIAQIQIFVKILGFFAVDVDRTKLGAPWYHLQRRVAELSAAMGRDDDTHRDLTARLAETEPPARP